MKFRIEKFLLWGVIFFMGMSLSNSGAQAVIKADSTSIASADCGYLKISFPQDSLKVYLDDTFIGKSPIEILELATGEHELRILNPKRSSWLNRDWSRKITVTKGDTTALEIQFPNYFFINSEPFDATVFANGKEIGQTPLIFSTEKRVNNVIIIKKDGYKDYVITLTDPENRFLNVVLEKGERFQKEELHRLALKQRSRVRKNLLTYSTLAFGFFSGTAAVYFKKRADDAYSKYMVAGSPKEMDRYFRDTEKFDKLSGLFYGLFEACFLFYVYLVFRGTGE